MRTVFLPCLLLLFVASAQAKGPKISDPKKVDEDYAVQGEYQGMLGREEKSKIGLQVIAMGEGKFRSVGYIGGLPGDGWDGESRIVTDGQRDGKSVVFKAEKGMATLTKDGFTVQDSEGNSLGTLKRVQRKSPTLGKKAPKGAAVLFDGKSVDGWQKGRMTKDGLLMEGTRSKQTFGDHTLHIEFRLPYQPQDRGQGRGNSGIYVQGRYEVQMLDSFGLTGEQNECGGLYSVKKPDVNMCLPPLVWQTYDIDYTAARYKDGKLVSNPRMTVKHNGVVIHKDVEMPGNRSTTAAPLKPSAEKGPVYLQNHGCPVRYRNIWVLPKS